MNIFLIATIISLVYLLIKFFEMRFIEKENKPFKLLIKDSVIVFLGVLIGNFIIAQLDIVIDGNNQNNLPPVFTDTPSF